MAAKSGGSAGRSLVGRRLGRYEVLAKLAAGGMATVYVARAQGVAGFERLVAVKILHSNLAHEEEFVRMFLDEARLAARIRHPNVVPTLDISDTVDSGYFIVMEYIEGDHLGQLLAGATKTQERLPQPAALRIISDALSGLGAAHKLTDEDGKHLNLVHRDVSPHNILVGIDGISRLTDFGVAKAEDRLTHTRDGQIKGKLSYMAPEQASIARTDPRSDLFSVGIILWESLTGARLFRSETTAGTLNKLVSDPIPLPSSVDSALVGFDPLLEKALSRDPDARFQSADDFAEALEQIAKDVGGMASLREVGKVVEKFAADRIQSDKKRIKDAIQAFGTADISTGVRPPGADDLISEPSAGSWTGSSASPISHSGASQASSTVSKMSGVYGNAPMPPPIPRGPLRPPPPPAGRAGSRTDEASALSEVDISRSELSSISSSQVGAARSSQVRLLSVLAFCCILLAAVVIWAVLRDDKSEVQVIQMEETAKPVAPPTPKVVQPEKPAAKTEPSKADKTAEPADEQPASAKPVADKDNEKRPKAHKPRGGRVSAPKKGPAVAAEPIKPDTVISDILKEPVSAPKPPPPPPVKKPVLTNELDPNNPYR